MAAAAMTGLIVNDATELCGLTADGPAGLAATG